MSLAARMSAAALPCRGLGALPLLGWPLAGVAIGVVSWGLADGLYSLTALTALPFLWGACNCRWKAWLLVLAYFAAGARGLPSGAVVFFGDDAPAWFGWSLWLAVSLLLSAPFALAWSHRSVARGAGFVLASMAIAIPPIAIVGWLNPASMAGVLFPGLGWGGLLLTLCVLFVLSIRHSAAIAVLTAMAIMTNAGFAGSPKRTTEPDGWMGFDTSFAQLSSANAGYAQQHLSAMRRIAWLQEAIAVMPANATLVLPETVIGRFDGVAQDLLAESEERLRAKRSRVLVGAEIPQPRSSRYYNAVVVLGSQPGDSRQAVQGIPVPISMWKPWADDGAIGDITAGGSTISVGNQTVGVAVCYEQLLTYSMLRLMLDRPDLITAVSNVWWAKSTNIPLIQEQSAGAFARLFNVPIIAARNQ